VTETDNVLVSALTHNPQPMHLDHEIAAASEFGKPLVNSIYTFGLMVGVSVSDTTLGTLVANLGYDKLVFPAPVFVGDTLRSESECLAVRASNSRPDAGIVTWAHRSFNQRGEKVCECTRSALLKKAPA
jgi:acyl dehydratase